MPEKNNNFNNKRGCSGLSFYVLLFIAILALMTFWNTDNSQNWNYNDLYNAIQTKQVKELSLSETHATVILNNGTKHVVPIISKDVFASDMGDAYRQQMREGTLIVTSEQVSTPWWIDILPTLFSIIFIVAMFLMMMRMQGGGKNSFGKSRAKQADSSTMPKVTFVDVAGADEVKEELEEVVEFLKSPKKFTDLGARIPRGVLLVGPPGTGKTLLAKAVAGEAGVPFFSISGSDFVEMFVGVGASRVRDLFEQAKKQCPSIVFIDEIDAVGRHRGAGMGGGHDEREQTLNQLLVEMDGFAPNQGVIIIAATNRPDILDPALLRPGRFDRQVMVGVPDALGREQILKVHTSKKPLAEDVDLKTLAKTTTGFSGADLENLTNEAALLAARKNKAKIEMADLQGSIIKVIAGPEKKTRIMTDRERKLTAFHEAGHAIAHRLMPTAHPVHQISIIPRGMAGGYTLSLPTDDKHYEGKIEMQESLVTLLGGRVAESIVMGDISTGASNDIQRATAIARAMVTKYGMSDTLGTISYHGENDAVFLGKGLAQGHNYSEETAALIDKEIKKLIGDAYKICEKLINDNRTKLDAVAERLLEKEVIEADEFEEIFTSTK